MQCMHYSKISHSERTTWVICKLFSSFHSFGLERAEEVFFFAFFETWESYPSIILYYYTIEVENGIVEGISMRPISSQANKAHKMLNI